MVKLNRFKLMQDGEHVGSCSVMEQAIRVALQKAAASGKPVTVEASSDDGSMKPRTVVYHPDGHAERLWNFERSNPFYPTEGAIYRNQGGGVFRCIKSYSGNGYRDAEMINVKSGWRFKACGCRIYSDGSIEWDYSKDGYFERGA